MITARLLKGDSGVSIAVEENTTEYYIKKVRLFLQREGFWPPAPPPPIPSPPLPPPEPAPPLLPPLRLTEEIHEDETAAELLRRQLIEGIRTGDPGALRVGLDALKTGVLEKPKITFKYSAPEYLSPKQTDIRISRSDLFVVGERQTGKSTAIFYRIIEELLETPESRWYYMAQQGKSARALLTKFYAENKPYIEDLVQEATATRITLKNGSFIEALNTTPTDIKGKTGSFWIDEFDQVLVLDGNIGPIIFASLVPIIRSSPRLHMILSANIPIDVTDATVFQYFRQKLEKFPEYIEQIVLYMRDVPTLQKKIDEDPRREEYLHGIISGVAGPDAADAQLHAQVPTAGAIFREADLQASWKGYRQFVSGLSPLSQCTTVIGVDPGYAHATGIVVLREFQGHIWEPQSSYEWMRTTDPAGAIIQGGSIGFRGGIQTQEELLLKIKHLADEFRPAVIWLETQVIGRFWADELRRLGLLVECGTFGQELAKTGRLGKAEVARAYFERSTLHLINSNLLMELATWRPAPDKADDRQKGDMADAFMHAIYHLATLKTPPGIGSTVGPVFAQGMAGRARIRSR